MKSSEFLTNNLTILAKKIGQKVKRFSNQTIELRERCKGVHCVDLDESFPTSIYLQNLASTRLPASQPSAYFQRIFKFPWTPIFNFQIPNFPISKCKPLPSFNFSDPSDLLRSLTIGGDPSDPFRSLRSLRSLRSVPIPLILSFLSLRMLIIVRTSSTRGARLGTRAGTCP